MENGPVPTDGARAPWTAASWRPRSARNESTVVQVPVGPGLGRTQGTRVWVVTIAVDSGYVPLFDVGGEDVRYLGVKVTPQLLP